MGHRQRALAGIGGLVFDLFDRFNDGVIDTALWQETDPDNKLAESGGQLSVATSVSGSNQDTFLRSKNTLSMADGRLVVWGLAAASGRHDVHVSPSFGAFNRVEYPQRMRGIDGRFIDISSVIVAGTDAFAFAYGDGNQHLFWRDSDGIWRRVIVLETAPASAVYIWLVRTLFNTTSWSFNYVAVPRPVAGVLGAVDGAVSVSAMDTFATNAGNFVMNAVITTVPSAGQIVIKFRVLDASNYLQVTIDGSSVDLDEVEGGVVSQLGTASAFSNGDKLHLLVMDDGTINVSKLTQANVLISANSTLFASETGIEFSSLGTGGAVGETNVYDNVLGGKLKLLLDATHAEGIR